MKPNAKELDRCADHSPCYLCVLFREYLDDNRKKEGWMSDLLKAALVKAVCEVEP